MGAKDEVVEYDKKMGLCRVFKSSKLPIPAFYFFLELKIFSNHIYFKVWCAAESPESPGFNSLLEYNSFSYAVLFANQ